MSHILRAFLFLLLCMTGTIVYAQKTKISGTVKDPAGEPVTGANVFILDSYDGATTDSLGKFSFSTSETGARTLVISFIGMEKTEVPVELNGEPIIQDVQMKEAFNENNVVIISAGGFGTNDNKRAVVLNPIDIVTTAGAAGDIIGALRYLPGSTPVGEEAGLFVRGGSAAETSTIIDEMMVQQPFFSTLPDLPSRNRFNPFLFKGTFFSTGGYSARYGQALSSALVLNSQDLPDTSSGGINLMLAGFGGFYTKKKNKTSISIAGNYTDVTPLFIINRQRPDWEIAPRGESGSIIFRHKPKEGAMLKMYTSFSHNKFVVKRPDPFDPEFITRTKMNNTNLFSSLSWKQLLGEKWTVFASGAYSRDGAILRVDTNDISSADHRLQGKVFFSRSIFKNSTMWIGAESHYLQFAQAYNIYAQQIRDQYSAAFAEAEFYITGKFAVRPGLRAEHSSYLSKLNLAPRLSLAYQMGKYGSVSLASGIFWQTPEKQYLFLTDSVGFEQADHLILNYQYMKDNRTFRIEGYYKLYDNLVRTVNGFDNSGYGYARGAELFWRDQKTLKNVDYWVSYSWLDTKRLYRGFPVEATPNFAAEHTASLVYKQFFPKRMIQVGASYLFATGRTYYNPDITVAFMSQRTTPFHNVSLNLSYLTTIKNNFTVIFVSVDNVLARDNVFGYRYSPDGTYRMPVNAPQLRTFFAGIFISIR